MPKNLLPRAAGILLHPTSFQTPYGIGDIGPISFSFINFLKSSGQQFWQMLPIGPTGYGDSPYQCISAFAGNPLLISPDKLIKMNLITKEEMFLIIGKKDSSEEEIIKWSTNTHVDFNKVRKIKNKIFTVAFDNFQIKMTAEIKKYKMEFIKFCQKESYWLDNFVLFYSLKVHNNLQSWISWPESYSLKRNNNELLNKWLVENKSEIEKYKFIQWIFFRQWNQLRKYAKNNGIKIIGDMPIFIAHDSSDVWTNPEQFTVLANGKLEYQAGVPPDYFSSTGQLWGNPLYRWDLMEQKNFNWFVIRFKKLTELFDWIRIDHFRGFEAYWRIKGSEVNAINGKWIKSPGKKLFLEVERILGKLPIIAEDLGIITPEVENLRDYFHFPGMKVLQFAFGGDSKSSHLPHNVIPNSIIYTGTHDNNTILGWWELQTKEKEKKYFKEYCNSDGLNIALDMIKVAYRSVANLVIVPIQDILGQDSKSRMNTPNVEEGNWQYIVENKLLSKDRETLLLNLVKLYGRDKEKKKLDKNK